VRHIGPTAQDSHTAFALGADDRHIGTLNADSVALAAIQGLYQLATKKHRVLGQQQAPTACLTWLLGVSVCG
jgi:hypothetical protein